MDYRPVLQKVIYIIEYNLEDDINLAQLSEQANISMYHFSRLFVVYTGLSPMEYVRRRRMLHAASAICSGEEILPVAVRHGYSSHSAFSKSFRKIFGCSPSHYRKAGNTQIRPCVNLYTQETRMGGKMSKAYETERLIIRNYQYDDWKAIQALAINKETSKFAKYDITWPTSDDECKKMVKFLSGTDFFWAVCLKEDGQLIGLIAFNSIDENRMLDIGHLFHTDYLSGDIMFEALQRMVQYVFDELEVDRIGAHNVAEWTEQIAPLKSLGFTPIDDDPGHLGITKEDWEKRNK